MDRRQFCFDRLIDFALRRLLQASCVSATGQRRDVSTQRVFRRAAAPAVNPWGFWDPSASVCPLKVASAVNKQRDDGKKNRSVGILVRCVRWTFLECVCSRTELQTTSRCVPQRPSASSCPGGQGSAPGGRRPPAWFHSGPSRCVCVSQCVCSDVPAWLVVLFCLVIYCLSSEKRWSAASLYPQLLLLLLLNRTESCDQRRWTVSCCSFSLLLCL